MGKLHHLGWRIRGNDFIDNHAIWDIGETAKWQFPGVREVDEQVSKFTAEKPPSGWYIIGHTDEERFWFTVESRLQTNTQP